MSDYSFFINFIDDDVMVEIGEPYQFSSFSHGVEKKKDGFARDTRLFAENTDLYFSNAEFERTEQYEDIDGTIMFNLTHSLKRLLDAYNEYGSDAQIELVIFFEGTFLVKCDFDLEAIETDLLTYFKCGFIENTLRSKFKKREDDIMIDIYSEKDLDGNSITKLQPLMVLLPSKPTLANSKWIKTDIVVIGEVTYYIPAGSAFQYYTFNRNPILYGIDDSLIPSPFDTPNSYQDTYNGEMKMIDAKSTKTSLKFKITSDIALFHKYNGRTGYTNKTSLGLYLRFSTGTGIGESTLVELHKLEVFGTETKLVPFPTVIEYEYPNILNEGEFVTLFWDFKWTSSTLNMDIFNSATWPLYSHVNFKDCVVEVSAIETSINSVIKGNRWIDVLKKSSEIISGLPVDAPRIDENGQYYNTLCTYGGGIRNIDNIPFNLNVKDIFEAGNMVALDYQVTESDVKIGEYVDFYSDKLLRKFTISPDNNLTWNTNKEYRVKTFKYMFSKYEQDREEQNTLDAIHTEEHLLLPNEKPMGTKTVKVNQILDDYKIDSLRRLGINPETEDSSLSDDTDLAFLDITDLPNTHREVYIGLMNISTYPGGIKIFSNGFRWDKLGLTTSSTFQILSGNNAGYYSVVTMVGTLLTLTTLYGATNVSESKIIPIKYSLPGVLFKARTSEGFEDIQGLISPDKTFNLVFSKLRNIQKWFPFLASCTARYSQGSIKVSFLKSNQDLSTRMIGETENLVEKDDIQISSINNLMRVTDRLFSVDIYPESPHDIEDLIRQMNIRNADGTIGGYLEFEGLDGDSIKGYPTTLEYIPAENRLEATCEEKFEVNAGFVNLLDSEKSKYSQFSLFGKYVTILDKDGIQICSGKRFTKVKINGLTYSALDVFTNDLQSYFS